MSLATIGPGHARPGESIRVVFDVPDDIVSARATTAIITMAVETLEGEDVIARPAAQLFATTADLLPDSYEFRPKEPGKYILTLLVWQTLNPPPAGEWHSRAIAFHVRS